MARAVPRAARTRRQYGRRTLCRAGLGRCAALALYLTGQVSDDPVAAANSPEAQDFNVRSIEEWVDAVEASGTADADSIAAAQQVSLAQFAPDLVRPE